MSENRLNTRELAEKAILIVLNQLKSACSIRLVLKHDTGQLLLAYRRGVKVGIIGGIVFGLVQMVIEG